MIYPVCVYLSVCVWIYVHKSGGTWEGQVRTSDLVELVFQVESSVWVLGTEL